MNLRVFKVFMNMPILIYVSVVKGLMGEVGKLAELWYFCVIIWLKVCLGVLI
jgi:hypothetical protein